MRLKPIPVSPTAPMEDARRHPGCRMLIYCRACRFARAYDPARIIKRLHDTGAGGFRTPIGHVARHVARDCPSCGRRQWISTLAWPETLDAREAKRLAGVYRN